MARADWYCIAVFNAPAYGLSLNTKHLASSMTKKAPSFHTSKHMADVVAVPESINSTSFDNPSSAIKYHEELREENIIPQLGTIAKMLPKNAFDIDTKTSLLYFTIDFIACVASLGFLNALVTSKFYLSLPLIGQAMMVVPLQILSGFALWCMWCIGHDAGKLIFLTFSH